MAVLATLGMIALELIPLLTMVGYSAGDAIVRNLRDKDGLTVSQVSAAISAIEKGSIGKAANIRTKIQDKLAQINSQYKNNIPPNVLNAIKTTTSKLEAMDKQLGDDIARAENKMTQARDLAYRVSDVGGVFKEDRQKIKDAAINTAQNAVSSLEDISKKIEQVI